MIARDRVVPEVALRISLSGGDPRGYDANTNLLLRVMLSKKKELFSFN